MSRPAETGGVASALALLVAHLLGVSDATVIVALGVVVGFVPAAITWAVVLVRGRDSSSSSSSGGTTG
jgi:hypothetical protein